jgi:hypothetical protein
MFLSSLGVWNWHNINGKAALIVFILLEGCIAWRAGFGAWHSVVFCEFISFGEVNTTS